MGAYGRAVAPLLWYDPLEVGQERGRSPRKEGGMAGAGYVAGSGPWPWAETLELWGPGKGVGLWSVCSGAAYPGTALC